MNRVTVGIVVSAVLGAAAGYAGAVVRGRSRASRSREQFDREMNVVLRLAVDLVDRVLIDGDTDAYARLCRGSADS